MFICLLFRYVTKINFPRPGYCCTFSRPKFPIPQSLRSVKAQTVLSPPIDYRQDWFKPSRHLWKFLCGNKTILRYSMNKVMVFSETKIDCKQDFVPVFILFVFAGLITTNRFYAQHQTFVSAFATARHPSFSLFFCLFTACKKIPCSSQEKCFININR